MSLRTKLTAGIGFLFAIIFGLSLYSSSDIHQLSRDADRILRDNYDSLVYSKNMLVALDDMRTSAGSAILAPGAMGQAGNPAQQFEDSKSIFETNLKAEEGNITETHEGEYVSELKKGYGLFLDLWQQNKAGKNAPAYFTEIMPAYLNTRQVILDINDINMQAIERKNHVARQSAANMVTSLAVVGAILVIVAFFYFWYFPFYISNSVSYLSRKMKDLLKDAGIQINTQTKDETFILLQSMELLQKKFADTTVDGPSKHHKQIH
jgi:hypothetical protein